MLNTVAKLQKTSFLLHQSPLPDISHNDIGGSYFIWFCFLAALAQCLVASYSPDNRKWKQNSEQTKISVICESIVCLCESLICQDDIALVSYWIFEGRPRSSMSRHHLQEKATITCSLYYSTRSSTHVGPNLNRFMAKRLYGKGRNWKRCWGRSSEVAGYWRDFDIQGFREA